MNLTFSPKILADVRNQAQVLLKRSCTLWKLVNTQITGIMLLCTGKMIFLMALSIFSLRNRGDTTGLKRVMNYLNIYILYAMLGFAYPFENWKL